MDPLDEAGDSDPWPDEPDEFDPDSLGPDPPRPPQVGTGESDVDRETFRAFWGAVVMANVGLLLPSLGLMLWYFRGMSTWGPVLVAVGAVSLYRAYRTYRDYTSDDGAAESDVTDGGGP